ncbi:MAG: oligosaccharide flippase family protein [Treponema sp.]|uniref:oligosaccharide flippase family protein n=1 Tax=Treponema sp. TaxID=166 RepID=UPI002A90A2D5|nr:oligosaccharide flippase family protein [Treponema sp.]MDY6397576.1 oligosaccharide flippase family protein [Treponema sp.]
MQQKSLKLNAVFNFIKSFMNIVFPIISFPYASRILLPEGIGKVNFANSIIEYFTMIAVLGVNTYAAREAAKIRDDKEKLSKFTKEILLFNFISTAVAYILFIICFIFIERFSEYRTLLIICSTKILFFTLGTNWLFTAKEEFGYITLRHTIFQGLSLCLLFSLVHKSEDYLIYAGIGIFSNVGANIFNFIYARKFVNLHQKSTLELKKHAKPIFTFFGVSCASKINSVLDTTMLGFLTGNTSVGFYSAAIKINQMVIELITSTVSSFMPRTSYLLEQNKSYEYQQLVSKVLKITCFFSFPAAAGLFVLSRPLILLFSGKNYLPATSTMQLLTLMILSQTINSFLNNLIITPQRKEKFLLYAQIIALILNLTLNYFFISKWGVFGAGLATLIVETTLPIVKLIPSWKHIKDITNLLSLLKSLTGTIVMFFVISKISVLFKNNFLCIITTTVIGIVLYAVIETLLRNEPAFIVLNLLKNKRK